MPSLHYESTTVALRPVAVAHVGLVVVFAMSLRGAVLHSTLHSTASLLLSGAVLLVVQIEIPGLSWLSLHCVHHLSFQQNQSQNTQRVLLTTGHYKCKLARFADIVVLAAV